MTIIKPINILFLLNGFLNKETHKNNKAIIVTINEINVINDDIFILHPSIRFFLFEQMF